ncbi:MAG: tRNA (adenosine(37)-N6)-threonylcarbamoyltransferase complex ATPase subunit type 1 TsaE [Spirochaetaceae bacterium]|jgi:tRNA threonylcarbamoyladenosine biosynthesis protein TsaE|nr:tRNA (adenosine(37)-N6)-threonylcarbamoyltransferase complex ATPase subunit type 1 TsaE [Spirochaetaceae bacterium]
MPKENCLYNSGIFKKYFVKAAEAGQSLVFITGSYDETFELGGELGRILKQGGVVALKGALGAGKTCLCAGICRALGVKVPVTSPTYTIIHEYEGIFPIYHIDAYRLSGADDFENSGGIEALYGGGLSLIEWSERVSPCLPSDTVYIEIKIIDDGRREIFVKGILSKDC